MALDETQAAQGYRSGYLHHNLSFLAASAMMDGDLQTALGAANRIASSSMSDAAATAPIVVLARFARWDDILRLQPPSDTQVGARIYWHYARGCALCAERRPAAAIRERNEMRQSFKRIPAGRAFGTFFNSWSAIFDVAENCLQARIDETRGDSDSAVRHWRAAIKAQDSMAFDDLPDWYYPVRESLGGYLLRMRRLEEAQAVFRRDLRATPQNPRSLFGLASCLMETGRSREGKSMLRAFRQSWRGASLRMDDL